MQSVSSRIWTRVAVFISYDDNNYTTGTSTVLCVYGQSVCLVDAATKRRHHTLLGQKTLVDTWAPIAGERKRKVCSIEVYEGSGGRVSSLRQEAHLLRHTRIVLPVRWPLRNCYFWFGWVGFYVVSIIVGYLMSNPVYTYMLNIYDLVWSGFMAYQPL